jgi:hypothetical protein
MPLNPDKYTVDFRVTLKSMAGSIASNVNSNPRWKMFIPQQEKGRQNRRSLSYTKVRYFRMTSKD